MDLVKTFSHTLHCVQMLTLSPPKGNIFSVVWTQWIRRKIFSYRFCVCMHALCLGDSCLLSQRRRWVVCFCCMHGRFGSAGGYLKWMLWVVVTLSATPTRSAEQFFPGMYMDTILHLLPHVCFVWVSYAALMQLADGTELSRDLLDQSRSTL